MGIKITSSGHIFLDSNIFIYALEDFKKVGDLAREVFDELKFKSPVVFTSVITIIEVLPKAYKLGLEKKVGSYLEFITGGGAIALFDITRETAIMGAKLRASYNIKTPDALQIASAIEHKANYFITADKRLPRKIGNLNIQLI